MLHCNMQYCNIAAILLQSSTAWVYGQTGSGKTHSMGTNYIGIGEKGIIPRAMYMIYLK
ncbi:hypothetical protein ALC57_07016 [Trachymyrmex cornetzi]|uniref:Kinesin motor domain-containing protein n=1 Tax=Trachymyrmex cornetzi TaxID=471704 RepID=A0A151J824_9HYME|nr:hypothetical protein ALC57_07016 [Trachymyrmex cornetzi]